MLPPYPENVAAFAADLVQRSTALAGLRPWLAQGYPVSAGLQELVASRVYVALLRRLERPPPVATLNVVVDAVWAAAGAQPAQRGAP